MATRILILEDNADRRDAMRDCLGERLPLYTLHMTDDPGEFVAYLGEYAGDILAVSLDHDLHERPDQSTTLTGMQVVDHLVTTPPAFPVLMHTSNRHDGETMRRRLVGHGWRVRWVVPFDGTTWVATDWYHALKRAIRVKAPRKPVSDCPAEEKRNDP